MHRIADLQRLCDSFVEGVINENEFHGALSHFIISLSGEERSQVLHYLSTTISKDVNRYE